MALVDLLLDLSGLSLAQVEALGRREYLSRYVPNGKRGTLTTHDGKDVYFFADRFEHAFFTTSDWARNPSAKDKLDYLRVARVRWIAELIAGRIPQSAFWEVPSPTGRKVPPNRLYLTGCLFMVWLEPRLNDPNFKFSTAYVCQPKHATARCKQGKRICGF